MPKAGAGSAGLEEYQVETSSGDHTGKVMTVLRKEESIYLAVETGTPPIKRDLRAIPWGHVAEVDHAALTIRLRPSVDVDQALMLDPGKAVEDGPADATLAESPEDGPGPVDPDASGPVDRTLPYAATFALAAFGLFAVFAIVALGSTVDASWIWVLLAVPAALLLGALVSGYMERGSAAFERSAEELSGDRASRGGRVRIYGCSPGCLGLSLLVSLVLTILINVLIRLF